MLDVEDRGKYVGMDLRCFHCVWWGDSGEYGQTCLFQTDCDQSAVSLHELSIPTGTQRIHILQLSNEYHQ